MRTLVTVMLASAVALTACEAGERVVLSAPSVPDTAVEDAPPSPDADTTDVAEVGPAEPCGDGVCVLASESATTCPADCVANCGDGTCTDMDLFDACEADCTTIADIWLLIPGESCVMTDWDGVTWFQLEPSAFDVDVYTDNIPYDFALTVFNAEGELVERGISHVSADVALAPAYLRVVVEFLPDTEISRVPRYCVTVTAR